MTSEFRPWGADLDRLLSEVKLYVRALPRDLRHRVRYVGMGRADEEAYTVVVRLRADATDLAAVLWTRWRGRLRIQMGYRIYPSGTPVPTRCPEIEPPLAQVGVNARLDLEGGGKVSSGADLGGRLLLTSRPSDDIRLLSGPIIRGYVVAPGDSSVLGVTTRPIAGRSRVHTLVGGVVEVPVVLGTTACRPTGPAGLIPGQYEAYAAVAVEEPTGTGQRGPPVGARAPLTVLVSGGERNGPVVEP